MRTWHAWKQCKNVSANGIGATDTFNGSWHGEGSMGDKEGSLTLAGGWLLLTASHQHRQ